MSGLIVLGHDRHISEMIRLQEQLQEEIQTTGIVCVPREEEHSDRTFIGGVVKIETINPKILEQSEEYFEKEIHWIPGKSAPMKRGKKR